MQQNRFPAAEQSTVEQKPAHPIDGVFVDRVFVALADETRRNLLETIARQGPASASRLAADAAISRQAIAKHLNIMEAAGLVVKAKHGREVRYQAQPHQLAATGRWMQRIANRWENNAATLSLPPVAEPKA